MHGNSKRDNELWTNCFKICERSPHPLSVNSRHWTLDRTEGLQFKVEMKLWTLERHLLSAKVSWIVAFRQHMVENLARAHHQFTTLPGVHISTQEICTPFPGVDWISLTRNAHPYPRGVYFCTRNIHPSSRSVYFCTNICTPAPPAFPPVLCFSPLRMPGVSTMEIPFRTCKVFSEKVWTLRKILPGNWSQNTGT